MARKKAKTAKKKTKAVKKTARKKAAKKAAQPKTTAQQLSSVIKSARDIMRKDKGLNGDLDRLPLLTWIMFLKFLDDREKLEEARAAIAGKKYKSAIEAPYRWRDWGADKDGITGDELIAFINQEEAIRPDGTRGPGLLTYLRSLRSTNGDRRRDVIATVFEGVINRMISGYLMRDVINLIDGIHFDSTEEIHVLARLYESMLREMRDAAGDSGEFYTPRPVIQFMVAVTDPKLGEVVLDPACGTGGFLAEAFAHLEKQCKTVQDRKLLQEKSIRGGEAKPLPYMLAQMNLLLHGLDAPAIEYGNSLAVKITEIGEKDRVDVILTNPPFGGEEEAGIRKNFPADKQTSETALLFLQLIMRKLRKPGPKSERGGRAAIVVPNGTLFGDGVCARIKEELLKEFNLHTIVRLPLGVFSPYTNQETALLFFDKSGPTEEVWYYEHPLPPNRAHLKNPCYTKSNPLLFDEFEPLLKWWDERVENDFAWKVSVEQIEAANWNLDVRHPKHTEKGRDRTVGELEQDISRSLVGISSDGERLIELLRRVNGAFRPLNNFELVSIDSLGIEINPESCNPVKVAPNEYFDYIDLATVSRNTIDSPRRILGLEAPSRARRRVRYGDVLLSTVRPYLCGHAVVPQKLDGAICSTGFAVLRPPQDWSSEFLYYMLISPQVIQHFQQVMRGAHYPALNDRHVRSIQIPKCPPRIQKEVAGQLQELLEELNPLRESLKAQATSLLAGADEVFASILARIFGAEKRRDLSDRRTQVIQ